jgi:hypothetical protein
MKRDALTKNEKEKVDGVEYSYKIIEVEQHVSGNMYNVTTIKEKRYVLK